MSQLRMGFMSDASIVSVEKGFSHGQLCNETERSRLEDIYRPLIQLTEQFNRKTVSFQANKVATLHSWFKYREGFSGELVEILLNNFGVQSTDRILDPFAGSCTALLQAKLRGMDAVGIELLPYCHWMWEAKKRAYDYDLAELSYLRDLVLSSAPPRSSTVFPHIKITESAFPIDVERELMDYVSWFAALGVNEDTKLLSHALLMSILEDVSLTRKDGQYLRWDDRATKVVERNKARLERGDKPVQGIDKGRIPTVKEAFLGKLDTVLFDLRRLQKDPPPATGVQNLIKGSTLEELPLLEQDCFHAVITSPPYANRYDYTRTYALELAFLNVKEDIFRLRQELLSCTVENKPKVDHLKRYYESIGARDRYVGIEAMVNQSAVLREVNTALAARLARGEINNSGVLPMIEQYFTELTFVFAELYRVCAPGAFVAFVNDNVRYAGEVIPVDLISTSLAESLGFTPVTIYVIPQKKGNSSQQMKRFGRLELRKSITVWQKH